MKKIMLYKASQLIPEGWAGRNELCWLCGICDDWGNNHLPCEEIFGQEWMLLRGRYINDGIFYSNTIQWDVETQLIKMEAVMCEL